MTNNQSTQKPFVSVVVCCLNGEAHIADCLRSIKAQTYPAERREIILVDDGSTDKTSEIARSFEGVKVIRFEKNQGIPVARNAGFHAAQGDIVAFIDSDCVADSHWLENLAPAFDDAHVVAAGGKILALERDTLAQRYMEASGYGNPARAQKGVVSIVGRLAGYFATMASPIMSEREPVEVTAIYTANAAYRAQKLKTIGGFDETLQTSEDSDVSVRIRGRNEKIVYVPNAVVAHRHYTRLIKVINEAYKRAASMIRFYAKHKAVPPIFPMPLVFVLSITMASVVFHQSLLITASIAMILPFVLYWWWAIRSVREKKPEYVIYGYIQLTFELTVLLSSSKHFVDMARCRIIKFRSK